MHEKHDVNNILLAAIFSAFGILFPVLFHLTGLGPVFMPMYIPLAIGAYFLSKTNALIAGFFTPLLSALITGMPPFYPPVAPLMIVQLSLLCVIISFIQHKFSPMILLPLLAAIIIDRILLVLYYLVIIPLFGINAPAFTLFQLVKSLPGIILMFILVPVLVPRLNSLIKNRSLRPYEKKQGDRREDE
ncbi:MAG: hypothetical protein JW864_13975 [Spirochaetes bacterium]|nr:hypothetical protein [Spirochaetota bacterium]